MSDADFKPSRLEVVIYQLKSFIHKFFKQNSLSMLSIVVSHDRKAFLLTPLSRKASDHLHALDDLSCSGAFSLQISLQLAINAMILSSEQYKKEILCVISSLNTSDPRNIFDTFRCIEEQRITCSVLSLSGEVFIYKKLATLTGGSFCVPETAFQIQDFFLHHLQPPVSKQEDLPSASLVPTIKQPGEVQIIGFPPLVENSNTSYYCTCHMKLLDSYYKCPRCQCIVCQLPLLCPICNLMLADYTSFTRSYHHLDPLVNFTKYELKTQSLRCYGCYSEFHEGDVCMQCPSCHNLFCETCDDFLHESIYHCPGCLY
ncbi:hypothetical protein WA171_006168 [Blastocystis sp. BT1]